MEKPKAERGLKREQTDNLPQGLRKMFLVTEESSFVSVILGCQPLCFKTWPLQAMCLKSFAWDFPEQGWKIISVIFLLLYTAIVLANGLIAVTIMATKGLTPPSISFPATCPVWRCDCAVTAPSSSLALLSKGKSFPSRAASHRYFSHFFESTEIFLLTVMSYDR